MSLALLPVAETMARSAAGAARRNILYSSSIGGGGSAAQRSEGKICSTTAGRTRKTKSSYPVKATMGREEAEERGRGAERAEGDNKVGTVREKRAKSREQHQPSHFLPFPFSLPFSLPFPLSLLSLLSHV